MQIISKKTVQFFDEHVEESSRTKELVSMPKGSITVESSTSPQLVPDWVRDTDHYKLLAASGDVMEVVVTVAPVPVDPTPKTGWTKKTDGLQQP